MTTNPQEQEIVKMLGFLGANSHNIHALNNEGPPGKQETRLWWFQKDGSQGFTAYNQSYHNGDFCNCLDTQEKLPLPVLFRMRDSLYVLCEQKAETEVKKEWLNKAKKKYLKEHLGL